jgi:hypothetical protein
MRSDGRVVGVVAGVVLGAGHFGGMHRGGGGGSEVAVGVGVMAEVDGVAA